MTENVRIIAFNETRLSAAASIFVCIYLHFRFFLDFFFCSLSQIEWFVALRKPRIRVNHFFFFFFSFVAKSEQSFAVWRVKPQTEKRKKHLRFRSNCKRKCRICRDRDCSNERLNKCLFCDCRNFLFHWTKTSRSEREKNTKQRRKWQSIVDLFIFYTKTKRAQCFARSLAVKWRKMWFHWAIKYDDKRITVNTQWINDLHPSNGGYRNQ